MPAATLTISSRNYSSWSLRPWLALRATGVAFTEQKLGLFTEAFARRLETLTPAGLVPVLLDGERVSSTRIRQALAAGDFAAAARR